MQVPLIDRRLGNLAGALLALVFAVLVAAPSADATTIYACVNKRTSAARIFTRKPKCRRNETRFVFSTQGPAGKNGANGKNGATGKTGPSGKSGTNGTDGTNGAGVGYVLSEPASVPFTGKKELTILTKTVPAGSYIVFAKTVVSSAATAGIKAAGVCELLDGGPGAVLDRSGWDTQLAEVNPASFIGEATLALQAAVSVKATTALSLVCSDLSPDEDAQAIAAASSQIEAIQTTQNL
jgi:hypothetical protein